MVYVMEGIIKHIYFLEMQTKIAFREKKNYKEFME